MRLREYAKEKKISYITAWRWWSKGYLVAQQSPSGTVLVDMEKSDEKMKEIKNGKANKRKLDK